MRRIFDLGFFVFIALACAGLDFYILNRAQGDQPLGVAQYIAQRKSDMRDMFKPPSLAAALPSDVEGWDITAQSADQILGDTPENRADQASEVALIKAVAALEKASHPAGDMAGMTMIKGNTRLRVMAVKSAQNAVIAGIETAKANPAAINPALASIMQQLPVQTAMAPYSVVDGIAFTELPAAAVSGDASLRMMRAMLGADLSVTVVTKSTDDAAIREAMQAIDFVMLNKLLQNPISGVAEGRTTDLRLDPANAVDPAPLQPLPALPQDGAAPLASLDAAPAPALAAASPAAKPKTAPAETAVFIAPPTEKAGTKGQPCVRRSGILVCPDG